MSESTSTLQDTFMRIHVPGHSHDAFCLRAGPRLFTGDVVFYGGVLGVIKCRRFGTGGLSKMPPGCSRCVMAKGTLTWLWSNCGRESSPNDRFRGLNF